MEIIEHKKTISFAYFFHFHLIVWLTLFASGTGYPVETPVSGEPISGDTSSGRFISGLNVSGDAESRESTLLHNFYFFREDSFSESFPVRIRWLLEERVLSEDSPREKPFVYYLLQRKEEREWLMKREERLLHRKQSIVSFEFSSPYFYLSGGNRFLPGSLNYFNNDPGAFSVIKDIPSGRNDSSVWVGVRGNKFFHRDLNFGLYRFEHQKHPGAYVQGSIHDSYDTSNHNRNDVYGNYFFAYNPYDHTGGFSMYLSGKPYYQFSLNLEKNERAYQGNFSGRIHTENQRYDLRIDGERDESWDYRSFSDGDLIPDRKGKSGLGAVLLSFDKDRIQIESAGLDRQNRGHRLIRIYSAPFDSSLSPAVGAIAYRDQLYTDEHTRYYSEGLFLGGRYRSDGLLIRSGVEFKKPGSTVVSLIINGTYNEIRWDIALFYRLKQSDTNEYFYFRDRPLQGSGIHFISDHRSLLRFSVRAKRFYILLQGEPGEGKKGLFGSFQAAFEF